MANPKLSWDITSSLFSAMRAGKHGISTVPGLVKRVIREELWREIECEPMRCIVRFNSFAEFVGKECPEGLGTDIQTLKNLCRDDMEALDLIDQACVGRQGERTDLFDNVQEVEVVPAPTGNSRDAALRRLRKDRPDLHGKVIDGELSANAAMIEAGLRKKLNADEKAVEAVRKAENVTVVAKALWERCDLQERAMVRLVWENMEQE